MRILNIIQCANLGGMEQSSLRLMRALQMRGHSLQLISLNPIAGLGPLLCQAGIQACGLEYTKVGWARTSLKLRRLVADSDADALILTGHNLPATMALLGVGPKRKLYAVHYHHQGVMPSWRWRLIYRMALLAFQTITFPSDYVRREAEAICPSIAAIAETVRNPLEMPPLPLKLQSSALRARYGIPPDAPVVGNAGWLIGRKRFDVFLRVAAKIHLVHPNIHFLIAGDGNERRALEVLASELGLSKVTHFTGWLSDLDPFYAAIDVLLFNSDWDCFGNTPVEAMARAIPVVASVLHGGLLEVIDARNGWLMDKHDEDILCSNVLDALGPDGKLRAAVARRMVCEVSNPHSIAERIEQKLSSSYIRSNF